MFVLDVYRTKPADFFSLDAQHLFPLLASVLALTPPDRDADSLNLKIGQTSAIIRRIEEHEVKCAGVHHIWAFHYKTKYPKLLGTLFDLIYLVRYSEPD